MVNLSGGASDYFYFSHLAPRPRPDLLLLLCSRRNLPVQATAAALASLLGFFGSGCPAVKNVGVGIRA